ncbi:MAG: hypothetical protein NVSMB9_06060 [Isosphaeraceae bacterium]
MTGGGGLAGSRPGHRVRVDRSAQGEFMPVPAPKGTGIDQGAVHHSGRLFVSVAVIVVLVVWGSLYLTFRHWRTRYRERAAFGARVVATAVDPLATLVPEGEHPLGLRAAGCAGAAAIAAEASPLDESPAAWRSAVAETHAMLVTLTAANLLDANRMRALGEHLVDRVSHARPETARATLATLWDEIENQSTPIVRARHTRPTLLPPWQHKEIRWMPPKR